MINGYMNLLQLKKSGVFELDTSKYALRCRTIYKEKLLAYRQNL
jgi:hypothetical protein